MPTSSPPPEGYTPEMVIERLYRAGATLIALNVPGCWPADFRSCMPVPLGTVADDMRPAPPSSQRISDMDQVLGWVRLIPEDKRHLRLVLNSHLLCSPLTGKPLFSFRRIGQQMGLSHITVRSYWLTAVGIVAAALNRPLFCHHPVFAGTKGLVPPARPTAARVRDRVEELA